MTFSIPEWVLWTLGITAGSVVLIVLCLFAYVGLRILSEWEPPRW